MSTEINSLRERANAGLHDFVFDYITRQVRPGVNAGLLDIGCGSGAWLSRFQQKAFTNLAGIDLDTAQFALNLPATTMNLDEYQGELMGEFGLITALELIEHLENPGNLFRLAQKNLVPGGDFVISTPNIQGLPARLRFLYKNWLNHFDDKSDPTHIYPVYLENLQRVAPRHGLTIKEVAFFPANGYGTYRGVTRRIASFAGMFLPDNVPGDNIIVWMQKTG